MVKMLFFSESFPKEFKMIKMVKRIKIIKMIKMVKIIKSNIILNVVKIIGHSR